MHNLNFEISSHLISELDQRKSRNKQYSLRAYAKQLGIEPSLLSKIIRQKVIPTPKTLEKLISSLSIENSKKASLIAEYRARKDSTALSYKKGKNDFLKINKLSDWPFESWNDLIIFSMLGLVSYNSASKLSKQLEIDEKLVKKSLERLRKKGLVVENNLAYSLKIAQVSDDLPLATTNLKKNIQKKFLKEAILKIDQTPIDQRLNGTLTFPLDPKLLPKIKKRIASFMTEINGFSVAQGSSNTSVYNLTIALYPLTKES